ncbi:hypothetical protein [Metabacillus fastidiosus]|uniref:Uncharacterized protein n=1 Tax=Metabacillus fastidiosus TaxID=1458 RepID=A0ABU6NZI6_9BACI|nr:hypothetical protein [Metabacillus fastidiosus]MED4402093.1 hypothetical protein [Metabacillus fastidiosus]
MNNTKINLIMSLFLAVIGVIIIQYHGIGYIFLILSYMLFSFIPAHLLGKFLKSADGD